MSVVFIEGFDMYNGTGSATGLAADWVVSGGQMITGRFGGQGVQFVGNLTNNQSAFRVLNSNYTTFSFGMAFKFATMPPSDFYTNLNFMDSTTIQCSLRFDTDGSINAMNSGGSGTGTVLGSTPINVIQSGVWHYVEVEITISNSVGVFNIYVDGNLQLSLSGVDTQSTGNNYMNRILIGNVGRFNGPSGGTPQYDDFYMTNTLARLGERRVETLRANADTAQKDFTPNSGVTNYTQVDETLVDGNTTYVQSGVIGAQDLYDLGDLSTIPAIIDAINVVSFALKTDATTRGIYNSIKSGSVDSDGTASMNLASAYLRYNRIVNLNPNGNAPWTTPAINALQIGPKVAS